MCNANNEKREKTIDVGKRTTKWTIIRTLGEKENYKNLGILETDSIKRWEMKEKVFKK